jgi:hypothetical protein
VLVCECIAQTPRHPFRVDIHMLPLDSGAPLDAQRVAELLLRALKRRLGSAVSYLSLDRDFRYHCVPLAGRLVHHHNVGGRTPAVLETAIRIRPSILSFGQCSTP